MDGNGRWATNRGWPRLVGHRKGAERVREIVQSAPRLGIRWLTIYAFSTENWKRSTEEVLGLMSIFARYIEREADRFSVVLRRFEITESKRLLIAPMVAREELTAVSALSRTPSACWAPV